MGKLSLAEQILAAEDIPHEDVEVPEWGVTVQVRGLSGIDRDAYEAKMAAVRRSPAGEAEVELRLANYRAKLLVKVLHDPETGERLFDDKAAQQLGAKNARTIERLFDTARRLSGMDDKAVETARGNSGTAPSGGSTTG